jgi:hypothetical protein
VWWREMETAQHSTCRTLLRRSQFARPCRLPLPLEQGRYHCWRKFDIIIVIAEDSPVRHIQLYMQTLPPALRSIAA